MIKKLIIYMIIVASLPSAAQSGEGYGTIRETDTAIIVEYYGNEEDAKAARITAERDDAAIAQRKTYVDQKNIKTLNKQSARLAAEAASLEKAKAEKLSE